MSWIRKPRFLLVYPLAAAVFFIAHTTARQLLLGIPIVLLGECIRLWANGYVGDRKVNETQWERGEAKIGELITAGPYAYVRHPLYFGTFLIGAGVCVIVGNLWAGLAALAFFLLIYRGKMFEEEAVIRHEWGQTFERYQRAIPRWLPNGRRYDQPHGHWGWKGIAASKEPKTLVWVVVVVILLYFRAELFQEHHPFLGDRAVTHLVLLGLVVVFVAADGLSELVRLCAKRGQGG